MTHFQSFDNLDDMYAEMNRRTEEGNAHLHDKQRSLTWGSHWVRFIHQMQPAMFAIFGRVWTREEVAASEDPEVVEQTAANLGRGYMFGTAYSTIEPDGELGDTHRYNAWPISEALFEAAREARWDIGSIGQHEAMQELGEVLAEWMVHERTNGADL